MFGLIRLAVLCLLAFVVGVMVERANQSKVCGTAGGTLREGLCITGDER